MGFRGMVMVGGRSMPTDRQCLEMISLFGDLILVGSLRSKSTKGSEIHSSLVTSTDMMYVAVSV